MLTLNSRIALRDGLRSVDVDDATVITDRNADHCYGVELIARRIWQLIPRSGTVAEICEALLMEYEVDRELCQREVLVFLNQCSLSGLIRIID